MSFLLFGSVWFWIIAIIAFVLVTAATERGSGVGATVTLLVTLALFFFCGNKVPFSDFFSFVIKNPGVSIAAVAGYIVLGACWAILKWYFFLIKQRDKYQEELSESSRTYFSVTVPTVSQHKSEIMVWMLYWPFSIVWTLLDNPLKRVFHYVYVGIRARMQHMANRIFEPVVQQQRQRESEVESRRQERSNGSR